MDLNPSRQWPWFRACDGLCWIWVEFGAFYETLQCSFVYFGEEQSCWQRLGSMCGGSTVKLLNCARLIFGLFRDNFQDQGWSLCLHTSPPRPHRLVSNCPDQIYVQYVQMIDIRKTLRKCKCYLWSQNLRSLWSYNLKNITGFSCVPVSRQKSDVNHYHL